MACELAEFIITDGNFTLNLLDVDGFHINGWNPTVAEFKGGGVWGDSPYVDHSRPLFGVYDNIEENISLNLVSSSVDSAASKMQILRRLLRQASVFWFGRQGVVWIQVRMTKESNRRYAVVLSGQLQGESNHFSQPSIQSKGGFLMDSLSLTLMRMHWTANRPGASRQVALSQEADYNGFVYGTVDEDEDVEARTGGVIISNKRIIANITNIHNGTGGSNLIGAVLPFTLFDAATEVLFGVDASIADSSGFTSLVFDIGDVAQGNPTIVWEFLSGAGPAWSALTMMKDNTSDFTNTGVNSVHFTRPDYHTGTSPGGGLPAGFWVRARISAGAFTVEPTQQNRNIYTVTQPFVDIAIDEVGGDIPALAIYSFKADSGQLSSIFIPEVIVGGIRSVDRGERFTSFINVSDEGNPVGINITAGVGTFTTDNTAPTGRLLVYTTGAGETDDVIGTVNFDGSICNDFNGKFRLFFRADISATTSGYGMYVVINQLDDIGNTMSQTTTKTNFVSSAIGGTGKIFDLGEIEIPLHGSDSVYGTERHVGIDIELHVLSDDGGTVLYEIQDMVLIPVDEWSFETRVRDNTSTAASLINERVVVVDSTASPLAMSRLIVDELTGTVITKWIMITNGQVRLNSGKKQRLWLLSHTELNFSEHEVSLEVRANVNEQYFSLIGEGQ